VPGLKVNFSTVTTVMRLTRAVEVARVSRRKRATADFPGVRLQPPQVNRAGRQATAKGTT
jgi:hypothetical protein